MDDEDVAAMMAMGEESGMTAKPVMIRLQLMVFYEL